MKSILFTIILAVFVLFGASAQKSDKNRNPKNDSITLKNLNEIVITAVRTNAPLKELPAAISVVTTRQLQALNKTIDAGEILRLVPGVKVDNGTGGSRIHLYIRGQGVLSETGFRGIQVLVDGISMNDPGGFCPDLYDLDWATVKRVEVVKGLAASSYGGSATGGVVNILTQDGGDKPVNSMLYASAGSYGFWKILGQVDGTQKDMNYRVSYSHTQGHGYRIHQSFMGDNFSEKMNWQATDKIKITQLLSYTNYFNQNSEGINLGRYDTVGHTAANTDAIRYNEFHLTRRLTGALIGKFDLCKNSDLLLKGFARFNNYQETSNNGDDFKPFTNLGFSAQYNLHSGKEKLKNHFSIGADFQTKKMTEHEFAVPDGDHIKNNRVDSYWSQETFDLSTLLINQIIKQRSAGIFLIDKLDIANKLYATVNLRYDYVYNELINNIPVAADSLNPNGSRTFDKPTYRIGLAWDLAKSANIYANYGTGFLVPTEDELYNNPDAWGGFNNNIKPSTSQGFELGVRGDIGNMFHYDLTGFYIDTKNEFYRYSVPGRGNNTAFFGNKGASNRYGIETFLGVNPVNNLNIELAYTYSHCTYTSPDSVKGHFIPQCPQHILAAEVSYNFLKHFTVAVNVEYQSKWCIQVDDSIYQQFTENGIKRSSWVNGYKVFSANVNYNWKLGWLKGDIGLYAKNLFDEQYFGFTEPNNGSDYNSFQPAPGREFFVNLRLKF
ncbi:MAG: TonB-dependent receptor [Bacteroidetes bacterium]|nr:TonB-dependent receptor [Bacteroidota bacterium]